MLLQISRDLDKYKQEELSFYCSELIPREDKGFLNILRPLECAGKISSIVVKFLKEAISAIKN